MIVQVWDDDKIIYEFDAGGHYELSNYFTDYNDYFPGSPYKRIKRWTRIIVINTECEEEDG